MHSKFSIITLIFFSSLFIITSCQEKKVKVPYYEINQTYTTSVEKGEIHFDLTTTIDKVIRVYEYSDNSSDKMYGIKITGIHEDNIEKYLLNEYSKAEKILEKFKHVDQMIDKDYKQKPKKDE